jgi:hypothetical protein
MSKSSIAFYKKLEAINDINELYELYNSTKERYIQQHNKYKIDPSATNWDKVKDNLKRIKSLKSKIEVLSESQEKLFVKDYKSYPHYDNPDFIKEITNKQEFNYNRNDFDININPCGDLSKKSDKKDFDFELGNHQVFLKNFMNNKTPYKGLLLYHGVGTGKTCSAVTIAENFRDIYGRKGNKGDLDKRIIVLVPNTNVEEGWRRNIFDITKDKYQCTGTTYIDEFNEKNVSFNEISNKSIKINKMINKYYQFFGYREFANKVNKMIISRTKKVNIFSMTTEEREEYAIYKIQQKKNLIKQIFSNRVLIIDEVHNLRSESNGDSEDARKKKESLNMISDIVENADNLRLLLLSATPMFNEAKEILWFINILLKNDGRQEITEAEIFPDGILDTELLKNKSRGYISYLRGENPQSFPVRLHPCDFNFELKKICYDPQNIDCKYKYPEKSIFNTELDGQIEFCKLFLNKYMLKQKKKNNELLDEIQGQKKIQLHDQIKLRQFSNILYPNETLLDTFDKRKKTGRMMYSYKDSIKDFLQIDEIESYSTKIHNILYCILNSEGIIFIFSEYLEYGCIPIALALERLGIKRYNDNNIFDGKKEKQKYIDENGRLSETKSSNQASYILLTSNTELSFNKSKEIDALRSDKNINGEIVKVVIGSSTVAEGLDFKRIREVHILEPWYNLNKIEQIIGRGIRFCSHNDLIKEKRNVTVYLHAGYFKDRESIDYYLYKEAERKAKEMGEVETILKNNAIDCILNNDINHIEKKDVKKLKLFTSQINGDDNIICEKIPYDEPYTKICSYLDKCEINCVTQGDYIEPKDFDKSSLNFDLLNDIVDKLIKFIQAQFYINELGILSIDDLKKNINKHFNNRYDEDIIYYSLYKIISSRTSISHKNGSQGYLICKDKYLIFQPKYKKENIPLNYRITDVSNESDSINIKEFYKDYDKITNILKKPKKKVYKDIIQIITELPDYPTFNRYEETIDKLREIIRPDDKKLKKILGKPIEYDNDKSIETSCLKYIIDNLYEGSDENGEKHVLYKQLILKFNSYKTKKQNKDIYKFIYEYLKLNFLYRDEDDTYKILCNDRDDEPIGYIIMNNSYDLSDRTTDITKFYDIYIKSGKKSFEKMNIVNLRKTFKENGIQKTIDDDSKIPEKLKDIISIKSEDYHGFTYFKDDDMVLKFINLSRGKHGVLLYNTKTSYQLEDIVKIINDLSGFEIKDLKTINQSHLAVIVELLLKINDSYIRNDLYRLMNFKRDAKK